MVTVPNDVIKMEKIFQSFAEHTPRRRMGSGSKAPSVITLGTRWRWLDQLQAPTSLSLQK
jgi:hypothetical protein